MQARWQRELEHKRREQQPGKWEKGGVGGEGGDEQQQQQTNEAAHQEDRVLASILLHRQSWRHPAGWVHSNVTSHKM